MNIYSSKRYNHTRTRAANDEDLQVRDVYDNQTLLMLKFVKQVPPTTSSRHRFDFVEVLASEDVTPDGAKESEVFLCQIGCIVAVHHKGHCVAMFILALWLEELNAHNGPAWASLTPRSFRYLKYQENAHGQVHRQLLSIECVRNPACVLSMDCDRDALHLTSYGRMKMKTLLSIDFTFFTRYV
jgi:hypothetical protein